MAIRRAMPILLLLAGVSMAVFYSGCRRTGKTTATSVTASVESDDAPDPQSGREVFVQACVTCHGFKAQGLPHYGVALTTSPFVASRTDKELIRFIKTGRPAKAPDNKSGVAMPPGGNVPGLPDARVADVVAYLRQVQQTAKATTAQNSQNAAPAASAPAH